MCVVGRVERVAAESSFGVFRGVVTSTKRFEGGIGVVDAEGQ